MKRQPSARQRAEAFTKFDRAVRAALVAHHRFTEGGAAEVARGLHEYFDRGMTVAETAGLISHFEAAHSGIPIGGPDAAPRGDCPICEREAQGVAYR